MTISDDNGTLTMTPNTLTILNIPDVGRRIYRINVRNNSHTTIRMVVGAGNGGTVRGTMADGNGEPRNISTMASEGHALHRGDMATVDEVPDPIEEVSLAPGAAGLMGQAASPVRRAVPDGIDPARGPLPQVMRDSFQNLVDIVRSQPLAWRQVLISMIEGEQTQIPPENRNPVVLPTTLALHGTPPGVDPVAMDAALSGMKDCIQGDCRKFRLPGHAFCSAHLAQLK